MFSFFSFYILHLASTFVTLLRELLILPTHSVRFSSIKLRSPKSNESKLYELKQTQQISTINRYQLTFDLDTETMQFFLIFKWNPHEDLNLLVKDSSPNAKGWKIVKDDFFMIMHMSCTVLQLSFIFQTRRLK